MTEGNLYFRLKNAMHYVFVRLSMRDNKFYIGYSSVDVKTRLQKHNGKVVKSTQRRTPLKLVHFEAYPNKFDALRREKYFKTNKGKRTLRLMLRNTLKDNNH